MKTEGSASQRGQPISKNEALSREAGSRPFGLAPPSTTRQNIPGKRGMFSGEQAQGASFLISLGETL